MKPRQAFDAEREEAAAAAAGAPRPALAMAKRQVLVLLGAWLAVRALLMPRRCWQARRTRIFGSAERWGSPSVFW